MELSSREANKLLKSLNEDLQIVLDEEQRSLETTISSEQDIEDWRPDYNYDATKQKIALLNKQIRNLKHAINIHNTTTLVPELNMTIDEVLVYLPQLTSTRKKLDRMRRATTCTRSHSAYSELVDYTYLNYDKEVANNDYKAVCARLGEVQNALDKINVTAKFEVEL